MSNVETPEEMLVKDLGNLFTRYYKLARSEAIKVGIRHKRELQAKHLNHD